MDAPADLTPQGYYKSGFDGASWGPQRGMVFWPTMETRLELDQFSRQELVRRVRFLFANTGLVRGMVRNGAALVGSFTVQPRTSDADFNARARDVIRERMGRAGLFDLAEKFSLRTAQPMLTRCKQKDGDILTVYTGDRKSGARVAFYESHQLCSPKHASDGWMDGVLVGKHGERLAYGLRDPKTGTVKVIPAGSCFYHGSCDVPGHVRAVPPLAHAVNHAIDITEVWGFTKGTIKTNALRAVLIEREGSQIVPRGQQGMTGAPRQAAATTDDGSPRLKWEDIYEGQQVQQLAPGEKAKILTDSRPHPNQQQFWEVLIRDIAVGYGLQPEVIWQMAKLTGPGVRFVMDLADRWIKQQQMELEEWVEKTYFWFIGMEIAAGRLEGPRNPQEAWWRMKATPQRNLTIDRGQVSRARLDEIDAGVGTWEMWDELDGEFWEDRVKQRVAEVKYAMAACEAAGLSFAEVFPPRQGSAARPDVAGDASGRSAVDEPDEEEDDEDDEEP